MNEKIKLLIMKAGGIICSTVETDTVDKFDYHHHFDADRTIDKIDYHHFDAEKFAELIVRECIDIVDDEGCGEGGSIRAIEKIKQHFGVEE
jgi:hypothetical protein